MLLIEQVDRLSRLTAADWQKLRADLDAKQIRVVALDLPTSWMLAGPADDFTGRMFRALNSTMLDMLAAVARKHYDDRRRSTKSLDALLPVLYLRGISAGDFQEALAALLGKDAPPFRV